MPMVTKIMKWVCVTALLLAVTWRPAENHQMQLDFVVCGGALVGVLAIFLNTKSTLTQIQPREASHCKAVSVAVLSPSHCKRSGDANDRHN